MAGSDSTIYRGFYDSQYIQDRLRLYAQNEEIFRLIALRQVNPLSILTIISEKFGTVPANMLSDWEFNYQEFDELPYNFTMQAASTQPVSGSLIDYVKLTNNAASGLNPSHRLMSSSTYTAGTVTAYTHVSTTFNASTAPYNEILRVLQVGQPDSSLDGNAAATGYTWVKVKRAHPASTITGQLVAIPTATVLTLVNSVAKTNSRPNPPIAANGKVLSNVIQITRESYGVGEHLTQGGGIKTLLMNDGAAQLGMNYELVNTRLMKTIERSLLVAKKSKVVTGNESEYETGGVLEFIPSSNYLNVNGIYTVATINKIISQALDTSGVRELWMFGGSTHTKALASAFENKRGFGQSTEMSVKYGLNVSEITGTGRDGIVYYVNAPVLSEIGMDDQALMLNLTEYNYGEKSKYGCFQIAEKVPLADLPEKADSYEENSGFRGQWRELYTAYGLVRRLQGTHFRVHGLSY